MSKLLVAVLLTCLVLSGCWDRNEIEEVGFVMAVAFDPSRDQEQLAREAEEETGTPVHEHGRRFSATFQVAIPSQLTEPTGGGSRTALQPFFNITSSDLTNFKMGRNLSSRQSRIMNYEHIKVILINEELARQGLLEHLIDFYIRDHEMRRRAHILITKGEARHILEDKLPLEDMPALSIEMTNENYWRILESIKPSEIGEIAAKVLGQESYLISRITKGGEGDLKVAGAAVFLGKTNRMVGWLGEEDVKGYNWIMGQAENGIIETEYEPGHMIVFETRKMSSRVTYERHQETNRFHVEIRAEGSLGESWLHQYKIDDEQNISKLEQAVARKIEEQANRVLRKMQTELYTDIFQFGQKIKHKDYAYWKQIKENWDGENGEFSKAEMGITANVRIRHYMLGERLN
ncbi:germination protein, Ger(x)C family [Caldalkalibacillus thermarum TA2.A1]|uniref:Ger(X)C family spore germination protein n=1 Tax=Caldalkalibacillus thermarum (strain TA2.A1) TaxID=986075 RepID=F5L6F6_CALTT|nr:Ger(x)C family spore germination protein [Caldalkalibacillus thermarum]EGL83066.1 germination protein, Ger(x)C family [Caldalkalibacillus thermarum TA2.A1]QZT34903.1 Ger(x)C family spore germination protein [Caldalkalibacillus thermarum TA2.A1]